MIKDREKNRFYSTSRVGARFMSAQARESEMYRWHSKVVHDVRVQPKVVMGKSKLLEAYEEYIQTGSLYQFEKVTMNCTYTISEGEFNEMLESDSPHQRFLYSTMAYTQEEYVREYVVLGQVYYVSTRGTKFEENVEVPKPELRFDEDFKPPGFIIEELRERDSSLTWCYVLDPRMLSRQEHMVVDHWLKDYTGTTRMIYNSMILCICMRKTKIWELDDPELSMFLDIFAELERTFIGPVVVPIAETVTRIEEELSIVETEVVNSTKQVVDDLVLVPVFKEDVKDIVNYIVQHVEWDQALAVGSSALYIRDEVNWAYDAGSVISTAGKDSKIIDVGREYIRRTSEYTVYIRYPQLDSLFAMFGAVELRNMMVVCKHAYMLYRAQMAEVESSGLCFVPSIHTRVIEESDVGFYCHLHNRMDCDECDNYNGDLEMEMQVILPGCHLPSRDLTFIDELRATLLTDKEDESFIRLIRRYQAIGLGLMTALVVSVMVHSRLRDKKGVVKIRPLMRMLGIDPSDEYAVSMLNIIRQRLHRDIFHSFVYDDVTFDRRERIKMGQRTDSFFGYDCLRSTYKFNQGKSRKKLAIGMSIDYFTDGEDFVDLSQMPSHMLDVD